MLAPLDNPLPDCLFMKLHCEPVQISVQEPMLFVPSLTNVSKNESTLAKKYSLKLTLRFGEQTESFPSGAISFGLSRGQLKLELTDAKLLMETVKLTPRFSAEIIVENVQENSEEQEKSLEVKVSGGVTGKQKTVTKNSIKYQDVINQVYLQGTEESPIWTFYAKSASGTKQTTNNLILQGLLQQEFLGILEITGCSPQVKAFFRFDKEDIEITNKSPTPSQSVLLQNNTRSFRLTKTEEKDESIRHKSRIKIEKYIEESLKLKNQSNTISTVEVRL